MASGVFAILVLAAALVFEPLQAVSAGVAPSVTLLANIEPTTIPTPRATPRAPDGSTASEAPGTIVVRGNVLAVGHGFIVFSDGRALRLRDGTAVPHGITLGSDVRATIDRVRHDVEAIERDPRDARAGEIAIGELPADFVVGRSAASPGPTVVEGGTEAEGPSRASSGTIACTLTVDVPANTPPGDDVYVATDRSNYSPSEIRMQRIGSRRFRVTVDVAAGTHVRYEFTRGSYATVERDRSGGIVDPRTFDGRGGAGETTVARWADLD